MEVKDLSTIIYDNLSEVVIMKFGHKYPIPLAIRSFWYHKYEIVGDEILKTPNDAEEEELLQLIKLCKNLNRFTLTKEYNLKLVQEVLKKIADHCPKIRHLIIEETVLQEEEIFALCKLTTLEEISIKSLVDEKYLETLFSCLPNLINLKLEDEECKITGRFLKKLPKTLKGLRVYNSFSIDLNVLLNSIELLNLELLHLGSLETEFYNDFISDLATVAPAVQDLYVLLNMEHFNGFGEFKQLTKLEIHCAFYINDSDVKSITKNCTLLIEFNIEDIPESLTEAAFGYFGNLPNLKTLSIGGSDGRSISLYQACMSGISKCLKVETLLIKDCGLTNYAAIRIIHECHFLLDFTIKNTIVNTDLIPAIAKEFQKPTKRINQLLLSLSDNKPGRPLPEEFGITAFPLMRVTIRQEGPPHFAIYGNNDEDDLVEMKSVILDTQ